MAIPDQYKKYRENTINALTAGELIILLFEEASVNINKAIMHINNKDICGAHNCIVKAENIILYLNDSLDMSFPISEKLTSLYDYMYDQLVKANIKKDISILESILKMTHELKDTWEKAEISNRTSGKSR
ncbi:MAG: flagellar biosynthetic protein FliS [Clostridia bacterium]|nr:flagellar biosynthetic protein FliS [Clostridia bacterium]